MGQAEEPLNVCIALAHVVRSEVFSACLLFRNPTDTTVSPPLA